MRFALYSILCEQNLFYSKSVTNQYFLLLILEDYDAYEKTGEPTESIKVSICRGLKR